MFHRQKIKVYFTSGHSLTVRTSDFVFTWKCDQEIGKLIYAQHPGTWFNMQGISSWAQHAFMFRLRPTLWGRIMKLIGK